MKYPLSYCLVDDFIQRQPSSVDTLVIAETCKLMSLKITKGLRMISTTLSPCRYSKQTGASFKTNAISVFTLLISDQDQSGFNSHSEFAQLRRFVFIT